MILYFAFPGFVFWGYYIPQIEVEWIATVRVLTDMSHVRETRLNSVPEPIRKAGSFYMPVP